MKRALVLLASTALLLACQSIIDADFDVERVSCAHRGVPPRPPPGNYNNVSPTTTVAVRHVNLGDDGTWPRIGVDQDGVCTNRSQRGSCQRAAWATPTDVTDGDDGIDNGCGKLLGGLQENFGTALVSTERISGQIESGEAPPMMVFRISDYSGTFSDDQLKVEWFNPALVGDDRSIVRWNDGSYPVPIDDRSVDKDGLPYYVDSAAYANKGVVVAHFENRADHPLLFRLGKTLIHLHDITLVFDVPAVGGTFVKGVFSGNIYISELLGQISGFTGAEEIALICTDSAPYAELKRYFCSYADLASQPGPDAPCDLISFGLAVDLAAVRIGAVKPPEKLNVCPPGTRPGEDTCAGPASTTPPDAGQVDGGGGENCVAEGTPSNEKGLGAPCFESSECQAGICSAQFGAPANARFCTMACAQAAECGSGMQCLANAFAKGCVPDACAPKDGG